MFYYNYFNWVILYTIFQPKGIQSQQPALMVTMSFINSQARGSCCGVVVILILIDFFKYKKILIVPTITKKKQIFD